MKAVSFSRFISEQDLGFYNPKDNDGSNVPSHEELSELPWFKRLSTMYDGDLEWVTGNLAYKRGTRILRINGRRESFGNNDYWFYPFNGTILRSERKSYKTYVEYRDINDWNTNIGHVYLRELHYLINTMSIGNTAKMINNKEIGKLLELSSNNAEQYPGLIPSILDAVGIKLTKKELTQMKLLASIGLADDIPRIFKIKD